MDPARCADLDACLEAAARVCPAGAILKVRARGGLAAGTPYLAPARISCLASADMPCAAACPTDALTVPAEGWEGYRLGELEFLPERCVTFRGQSCRACADACPRGEQALVMDGLGHPVLKLEGCVSCGSCIRACISVPPSFVFRAREE